MTIYRGVPADVDQSINPGDYVTTNAQLAQDYAGSGNVVEMQVPASHVLNDADESGMEKCIYRPQTEHEIGQVDEVSVAVEQTWATRNTEADNAAEVNEYADDARQIVPKVQRLSEVIPQRDRAFSQALRDASRVNETLKNAERTPENATTKELSP